jgi:CRISPR-associated protein Cas6
MEGHEIRLGVPQVRPVIPAPNLMARLVVIKASSPRTDPTNRCSRNQQATKRYLQPAPFLDGVREALARKNIQGRADLPVHERGPRAGQPRRHVLRIRDKTIVGFSVLIEGLTADESVRLQEEGIGGRSKMGCGFFVPLLPR